MVGSCASISVCLHTFTITWPVANELLQDSPKTEKNHLEKLQKPPLNPPQETHVLVLSASLWIIWGVIRQIFSRNVGENLSFPNKTIKITKFFDKKALNQLGVLEAMEVLLRRAGLSEFVHKRANTYRTLTLEFLSTVEHVQDSNPSSISF